MQHQTVKLQRCFSMDIFLDMLQNATDADLDAMKKQIVFEQQKRRR